MRFTSPMPAPWRRSAPQATATPSSRAIQTVVSASAICSTVRWEQNSGGVSSSRCAFSAAISSRTSSCKGLSTAIVTAIGRSYPEGLGRAAPGQSTISTPVTWANSAAFSTMSAHGIRAPRSASPAETRQVAAAQLDALERCAEIVASRSSQRSNSTSFTVAP